MESDVDTSNYIDMLVMHDTLIQELRELVGSEETKYSSESSLEVKFQATQRGPIAGSNEIVDLRRGN